MQTPHPTGTLSRLIAGVGAAHEPPETAPMFQAARAATSRRAPHRAFTLIEIIVVTVVMMILAGAISIRLRDTFNRRVATTCIHVQNLLDALAHDMIVTQDRMALVYDSNTNELCLERYTTPVSEISARTVGLNTMTPASWTRDLLTQPVEFTDEIYIDSATVDTETREGSFRFEFDTSRPRPVIRITLRVRSDTESIILLPGQMQSYRESEANQHPNIQPEDLDAQGAGEEPW